MKTIQNRTEELRQIVAQAKESIHLSACDFENKAEVKALEKQIEAVFKNRINLIKSYENGGSGAETITYDGLQRRINAVLAYARENIEGLRIKYPKLNIENSIAELCAPCPSANFDKLNERYYIENAAALYILDQLRSSGKLDEALEFLPESREELDRIDMPNITDSVHCDDLIRGMMHVIRYRNLGLRGFDENKAFMDDSDATEKAETSEQTVGRSRFDAILSLLDPDTVSEIAESFKAQIDELADNLLLILSRLHSRKIDLTETKIQMIEDEIRHVTQATDDSLSIHSEGFETTYTVTDDKLVNAAAIEEELQKTLFQTDSFYMSVLLLTPERQHEVRELLGDEAFGLIKIPEAADPYAMCFGFLYLLDSGSDYIWLYNLPYLILDNACRELPWAGTATQTAAPEFSPTLYEAAKEHPEAYITSPSESILKRHIADRPFVDPQHGKISFAQLVYIMSGLVPPRGLPELSYMKALLQDGDLPKDEIDILYEYLSLAYLIAKRDENYVFIDEDEEDETDEADTDDNAEELREIKRENKNLKALISKLERRLRESGEALKNADKSLNEASAELAELRSMIRKSEKEQEDYTTTVTFPYTALKRAVVFGGHSSWLKAIRPLLPNVRFIEPSAPINTGLILNADVVWIQTNAMSHSSFYKIIDVVRKHNIELHYFKYASAEKCAEQLALSESEITEETE